jgi:hypothetical protein
MFPYKNKTNQKEFKGKTQNKKGTKFSVKYMLLTSKEVTIWNEHI